MAFRKKNRASKKMAAARAAKERLRLEGPAPEYPPERPIGLRRRITIEDFDFGYVVHVMDLYASEDRPRIDCYRAVADGALWHERIGWSRVLVGIRKAFPRLSAWRGE